VDLVAALTEYMIYVVSPLVMIQLQQLISLGQTCPHSQMCENFSFFYAQTQCKI